MATLNWDSPRLKRQKPGLRPKVGIWKAAPPIDEDDPEEQTLLESPFDMTTSHLQLQREKILQRQARKRIEHDSHKAKRRPKA